MAEGDIQITLVTIGHSDEAKVLREKVSGVFDQFLVEFIESR